MFGKRKKRHGDDDYRELSLLELIKQLIISRLPNKKSQISDHPIIPNQTLPDGDINHIAIVLDGVVEDVMRAQNRLAALVLSQPQFIEFDPEVDRPQIGQTRYEKGNFVYPSEELMNNQELSKTIKKLGLDKDNEN